MKTASLHITNSIMIEKYCLFCGKSFLTKSYRLKTGRGKYCSQTCAINYRNRHRVELTCRECGQVFVVPPSRKKAAYCSRECMSLSMRGDGSPRYSKVSLICNTCGKSYLVSKYLKDISKYCSRECKHNGTIGKHVGKKSGVYSRVNKTCPVCSKNFTIKASQDARCKDNCCSRKCADIWAKKSGKFADKNNPMFGKAGELAPGWRGGISYEPYCNVWGDKEYKTDIKKNRDDFRCQEPSCFRVTDRLTLHHIDYDKKNCHPDNLITLCISCNSRANRDREWHTSWYNAIMQRSGKTININQLNI